MDEQVRRRMNRWDLIQAICDEECARVMPALFGAIQRRVREGLTAAGESVEVLPLREGVPYCSSSGPKVTEFPRCDPSVTCYNMVLPLAVIECGNGPVTTEEREP